MLVNIGCGEAFPLRSVFNFFFFWGGTVQKDDSKPHTHLRCPPVPFDRHSVAEKNTLTIIHWQPYHYHPIGMGVDREWKTSLVCCRFAR